MPRRLRSVTGRRSFGERWDSAVAQISRELLPDQDLTIFTIVGPLSVPEGRAAVEDFHTQQPTTNLLWDFTEAGMNDFTAADVRSIAMLVESHASSRPGGRTAMVAASDFTFGLGRMYEITAETRDLPLTVAIFRTREEALAWLSAASADGTAG